MTELPRPYADVSDILDCLWHDEPYCGECITPLGWEARSEVWVHADTALRQCYPDDPYSPTAYLAAEGMHGFKRTEDQGEGYHVSDYNRCMSG